MLTAALKRDQIRALVALSPACMIPEGARKGELLGRHFDPEHIPDVLEFGEGLTLSGNYLRVAQSIRVEGDCVIITFRNANGLHIKGGHLHALQLELENGEVVDTPDAAVEGSELIVSLAGLAGAAPEHRISAVRFARENYYEVNLYNAADIPALPFRMAVTYT